MDPEDRAENPAWQQFRMNAITSLVNECVDICHGKGVPPQLQFFHFHNWPGSTYDKIGRTGTWTLSFHGL